MRVIAVPAVAAVVAMSVYIRTSPYEPTEALMHLIARSSCSAARSVGLAPSFRGELGYHARNDADGDGVACEWPGINVPGAANAAEAVPAAAPGRMAGGAKFVRPGQ